MQSLDTLKKKIESINERDYGAYQSLLGEYNFQKFILSYDCKEGHILSWIRPCVFCERYSKPKHEAGETLRYTTPVMYGGEEWHENSEKYFFLFP